MLLTRWLLLVLAAGTLFGADPTLKVSEADAKKAATVKPAPDYPRAAAQLRISGRVELEAIVAEDGSVEDVRPVKGNPLLTQAGATALEEVAFHAIPGRRKARERAGIHRVSTSSYRTGAVECAPWAGLPLVPHQLPHPLQVVLQLLGGVQSWVES